ncbi:MULTISPECIES: DUF998 domain-containing protein [Acidiplasma]|uniref:DUF998 domain-containing protein n=1 Tax=Acidiplasma cupricumulans TaxID=312540 RepID=A0A0N8VLJ2_9ARCH|nr:MULTISPECIES: DUF998 domain-containing protein [Acidiplasma]KJE49280.1 hypothetical protein TZ01_04260 [Acidiplasma sp. MBA-1]KQB36676.1 hypothetical protein AOG55_03470 [Acidiplasma cupricumulans]WMT54744.1 MAG: DUF998 domain-containing protein [Acidiplasma sp.]
MNIKNSVLIISGGITMLLIWIVIAVSSAFNPWFGITHNALSDLGGGNLINNGHPAPLYPWIYNVGLMIEGILIAILSSFFILRARNTIEIVGSSFFIISGLFLALIGIYHEGTYPHDFVSIWFFILATISYTAIGFSIILINIKTGISLLVILVIAWILFAIIPWGSVAENEIFGIVVIEIVVIIHIHNIIKYPKTLNIQK